MNGNLRSIRPDDTDTEWIGALIMRIDELERENERQRRRARKRSARTRSIAIAAALIASAATWGIASVTGNAIQARSDTIRNNCRAQHVRDCKHAISWWRSIALEGKAAIAWQRHERLKLKRKLISSTRLEVGNLAAWTCIHQREGAWNDTGDPYWGGLQMDRSFMQTYGPDMIRKYGGLAHLWSPRDQIVVAQRAYKTRGYNPWPNTARACGVL